MLMVSLDVVALLDCVRSGTEPPASAVCDRRNIQQRREKSSAAAGATKAHPVMSHRVR
jgi:hypothetical protein